MRFLPKMSHLLYNVAFRRTAPYSHLNIIPHLPRVVKGIL
nr:MAG TPA: hypothetical protein [Caudoviricetes sp.]